MKITFIRLFSATIASMLIFTGSVSAYEVGKLRMTYTASNTERGTSVPIPELTVIDLCGDEDGCTLRIGMYNWDGTGRTASRDGLFYYNSNNRNWRSMSPHHADGNWDKNGQNNNNVTEHVLQAWSCYFTDGSYNAYANNSDQNTNFGILSWDQYTATCRITIVD